MTYQERRIWIALDQHGSYKEKRHLHGLPRCITKPIPDGDIAVMLELDPDTGFDGMDRKVKISRGLPVHTKFPQLNSTKEFIEFYKSVLAYKRRAEQELGLVSLVRDLHLPCTLISGAKASNEEWVWWGFGQIGRECVDKNLQMILRNSDDPMISKLMAIATLIYRWDEPNEKRVTKPARELYVMDEDPYFGDIASRMFGVVVYRPIPVWKEALYPNSEFPVPDPLKDRKSQVIQEAGLPEIYRDLSCLVKAI